MTRTSPIRRSSTENPAGHKDANMTTNEDTWFYLGADDDPRGPVGRGELLDLVRLGHAREDALVWRQGFEGWRPFRDVEELKKPGAQPSEKQGPAKQPLAKEPSTTQSVPRQPLVKQPAKVRTEPNPKRVHLALGAGFGIVAIVVVSALYRYSDPARPAVSSSPEAVLHRAELAQSVEEAPEPDPMPVRVQNPFDRSETFEFPPGTSETDARNLVADLLMKRAMERQAQLKTKSARQTKSTQQTKSARRR